MTLIDQILRTSSIFAMAKKISHFKVSALIFGDENLIERLLSGGSLTTRRFESGMKWLSNNWPSGAKWPRGVPRPKPEKFISYTIDYPNIRSLRKELGWTQGDMANFLALDQSSVSRMERGQRPKGPVKKLLKVLTEQKIVNLSAYKKR